MNYKKFLKRPEARSKGQAALEYFILLAAIGAITIFVGNSFLGKTKQANDGLYSAAVERILNP